MATKTGKKARYAAAPGRDVDLRRETVRDSKGRRVTQAYVDRAVADVRARTRGRPSLSGEASPSPQVTFRLTPALRAKAERRAKSEGKRVSEVAREALEQYLVSRR